MADEKESRLGAVDEGPVASDTEGGATSASSGDPSEHPTVAAIISTFRDVVQRHRVNAGDQWVVWVDPARSHELLDWLKNDPTQLYDMMSDVTAVDYGGGRPIEVVYQMYSTTHKRELRIRCPE